MLSKKKKIFILVGMVALLVVTGCLNIFLNNKDDANAGGEVTYESLFATYRADRAASRQVSILFLNEIIESPSATAEAKASALASKLAITANMEMETVLEGIIKGAGFEDAFVTVSTENVNIIVNKEVLTSEEANKILDIVLRETLKEATQVIVTPIK